MKRIKLRLRSLFRRRALDRDLEDELRFHLDMLAQEHADPERRFGNITGLKEACREMWTLGFIEMFWQDFRYGLRTLARNPGFTAVAVSALALGIGANATVFTLVNAVLFKNLPFEHSDRIFYISSTDRLHGAPVRVSYPDYVDLRARMKSFEEMGAAAEGQGDVSDGTGFPQSYRSSQMTSNGFSILGQKPAAGRDFGEADQAPGAPPVAILSYDLWENRYHKDPAIIGRTIRLNTVPTAVIGVMPRGLRFPTESEFWTPLAQTDLDSRSNRNLTVFGRLSSGTKLNAARAELEVLAGQLAAQHPETNEGIGGMVQTYNQMAIRKKIRSVFLMLLGAVAFVLMIACANVANLLLARAVGRTREISIRTALGASRWRIIRQLLIESLLLSLAGGSIGWLLAVWGSRAFDLAVIPTGKPVWIDFSLDYRVLLYLSAVSIGTGVLFGLTPALRLSKLDVGSTLKEGSRGTGASLRGRWLSGLLVVVEMSLAVVLLAGAGLMIRGFLKVTSAPIGVNTAGVLTMKIDLPAIRYGRPDDQVSLHQRLKERLQAVPGVEAATILSAMPGDGSSSFAYELEGAPPLDGAKQPQTRGLVVGPDYFRVMQAPPLAGRAFTDADGTAGAPVAMVNQAFARRYWPGENPLGKHLRLLPPNAPHPWLTVVGVAPNIAQDNSNLLQRDPLVYVPYRQSPRSAMFVAARTRVPPATLGENFRRAVQAVDPDLPVRELTTLDEHVALLYWLILVFGGMFTIFAAIAFLLASVGLYAVIAHSVNQRTNEIGVRLAMGATAASVMRMVLSQGMRQLAIGLVLGLALAFGVTRALGELLVVSPTDPVTFTAVGLVLTLAGFLGCAVPARRAVRVDPAVTLRHE